MKKDELTEEELLETKDSDDSNKSSNKGLYVIEGIIAAAAVGFIAYALISSGKKATVSDNAIVSSDAVISADAASASIDNAIIYEDVPAIPDLVSMNSVTEEACIANVAAGTMLKLDNADGSYVYCNNFQDSAIYSELISVSDDEIDQRINDEILIYFPEHLDADHDVAIDGDTVVIDFVGTLNGVAFEGGTASDYQLTLGSNSFIDGFESGVVGMKVGDVKDLNLTFPADYYSADLAGQDVVFSVTLKSILGEEVYPEEITDEIVQQCFSDITTAAECKDYFKDLISQEKIYNYLCQDFYVSAVDPEVVNSYYMATMSYYDTMSTGYYGMSVEDLVAASNMTLDEFKNDVMSTATDSARFITLYNAIAAVGNVSITDDDIQKLADDYGCTIDELYELYGQQTSQDYILETKVMQYLCDTMNTNNAASVSENNADETADNTTVSDNATEE